MVSVTVCGAGPAGLTLAVLLAERGVDVTLHDGRWGRPWTATYGLWGSELDLLPGLPVAAAWPVMQVHAVTSRTLQRPYAVLDTPAWQVALTARALGAGVQVVQQQATLLPPGLVVDCTGHRPALVRIPGAGRRRPAAWQTAYGLRAHFDEPPASGPTFMDWRGCEGGTPSFVYALPYPDGSWLVEETSLAHRPAVSLTLLRERLLARLGAHRVVAEERVVFPMTSTVPRAQPVLAFGAAAGMVNPVSGFHLGWALQRAPGLADLLAAGSSAEDGWAYLWPRAERARHAILMQGLETIVGWDGPRLARFFEAFFRLPEEQTAALLTRAGNPLSVMARTFGQADARTRLGLVAGVRHLRR